MQFNEFDLCESKSVRLGKCMSEERRTAYTRNLVKEVKPWSIGFTSFHNRKQ